MQVVEIYKPIYQGRKTVSYWLAGGLFAAAIAIGVIWYFSDRYVIDIEAQGIDTALLQLAVETGAQVVFSPNLVEGYSCPEIKGRMTLKEVLRVMLANTDIQAEYIAHTIILTTPGRTVGATGSLTI